MGVLASITQISSRAVVNIKGGNTCIPFRTVLGTFQRLALVLFLLFKEYMILISCIISGSVLKAALKKGRNTNVLNPKGATRAITFCHYSVFPQVTMPESTSHDSLNAALNVMGRGWRPGPGWDWGRRWHEEIRPAPRRRNTRPRLFRKWVGG